ncbi:MAG: PASTA domain-containing protein, partial [Clostridia bacterium]|nr:PASTA domain-containing protein [Clostridia bacterium]
HYIVMELLEGVTLKNYINQLKHSKSRIDWKEAVHFVTQILRALQHAHEKGIIHRDIKPQNIMLLQDGSVKVTDFGIARFAKNETRTMTDKVIGSVHYISPEQARGDETDAKSDIYSVGVMLYELLTGKVPFDAENAVSVAIMQLQTTPVPPSEINNSIPPGLEEITLKSMQKNSKKRYQSAAEMLSHLEEFKRNPNIRFEYKNEEDAVSSRYIDAIDEIKSQKSSDTIQSSYPKKRVSNSTKYAVIGIVSAAVIVALIFGIMFMGKSCSNTVEEVEIPNFVGMNYNDIMKAKDQGVYKFNFIKEDYSDSTKPEGEVLDQNPKVSSGKKVKANSDIKLTVNVSGVQKVSVPDVKSLKEADAVNKIQSLGLVANVVSIVDETIDAGIVKNTDPVASTLVDKGSSVNVYVSKGQTNTKVQVPNVINETLDSAKKKITDAGLRVGTVTQVESSQSQGIVIETDPLPTSSVDKGSVVNIVVSLGKKTPKTVEVHIKLPNDIHQEVDFKVYVDGEITTNKVIVPAYTSYYTTNVTGSAGTSKVVAEIDGQVYYTYYIDFDNGGKIKEEQNKNFSVSSIVNSKTASDIISSQINSNSSSSSTSRN